MVLDVKAVIEKTLSDFIEKHRYVNIYYKYDEPSFGNGLMELENPEGIYMRIIRDRLLWYFEFKKPSINDEWIDLFLYLEYLNDIRSDEKEEIYSGKIQGDQHLDLVYKYLINNYGRIIKVINGVETNMAVHEYANRKID